MTKIGAAYLAASFLTSRRVDEVAADYIDWIDAQADESAAIDALLAAARSSKSSARVLEAADTYYEDFEDGAPGPAPAPIVDQIDPDEGPAAGGTVVTISGEFLAGTTSVTFGGTPGTALNVVDSRTVEVTTPAGTAGAKNVVLTTPAGTDTITGGFTYTA